MPTNKEIIQGYLDVVNKSLAANGDRFPWKQMLAAAEKKWDGANIGLGINEPDDDTPDTHTLEFKGGEFQYLCPGEVDCKYTWEADRNFMRHVVNNPDDYISNPMKINWDWMRSSLNVGDDVVEDPNKADA